MPPPIRDSSGGPHGVDRTQQQSAKERQDSPFDRAAGSFARPVAIGLATFTVAVLAPFLVGALANQIRADLGFGETGAGAAIGGFWVVAALASTWLGGLSERLGPARSLRAGALLGSCALLLVAVGARSWGTLAFFLLVAGLANALIQPAASSFLATAVPIARRGRAFGVMLAAIPLANLLGGLAVPSLALTVGWRWAFVGASVFAAVSALSVRDSTSPPSRLRNARRERRDDAPTSLLAMLAVAAGLAGAATSCLGAFLVQGAKEVGIHPGAAGWLFAGGSLAALLTRLVLGEVADHHRKGLLRVAAVMLVISCVPVLGLATGDRAGYVASTFVAFAVAWGWPGLFNLAIVEIAPAAPAFAMGIAMTGTYLGCAAGPVVFGIIAETASYGWAWSFAASLTLAGGAVMAAGSVAVARGSVRRFGS